MNPYADAANKGEKIDEDLKKELDKWILGTLVAVSMLLTYVTFYVIGFTPRQ